MNANARHEPKEDGRYYEIMRQLITQHLASLLCAPTPPHPLWLRRCMRKFTALEALSNREVALRREKITLHRRVGHVRTDAEGWKFAW